MRPKDVCLIFIFAERGGGKDFTERERGAYNQKVNPLSDSQQHIAYIYTPTHICIHVHITLSLTIRPSTSEYTSHFVTNGLFPFHGNHSILW